MVSYKLIRPKNVYFKRGDREHSETIATLTVGSLASEPDDVELGARAALLNTAVHADDGRAIQEAEMEGLDVSGALRDAYRQALSRARLVIGTVEELQA